MWNNLYTSRLLASCLDEACQQGYLTENSCKKVVLPIVSKKKVASFSWQEQKQLFKACQKQPKYLAVLFALDSGLRIGEICGLKWEDIDFSSSVLHVRRTIQRVANASSASLNKTQVVVRSPKTANALRLVPLSPTLKKLLMKIKAQAQGDYVISRHQNRPAEPRSVVAQFMRLKQRLGIFHGTFHMLRHSFATRCIALGGNVAAVSALLGHSSIKMTLDTYTSSFLEDPRHIVDQLVFH